MQLEVGLYLSYGDKSAIFSSSSTLSREDYHQFMVRLPVYQIQSLGLY